MSDENKGPCFGVPLPAHLNFPGGMQKPVPTRRDLEQVIASGGLTTAKAFEAALALVAAIERGGYDVSPCLICQELVVCIPDGLAMCRDCIAGPSRFAGRGWYFEDDLPSDYDYQANFDRSRVIDGVRMCPSIPKTPKEG